MTDSKFMLDGDVAVVTGAGTGIGEGTAHVLANAGAKVVLAGRRLDNIEKVAADIRANGGEAIANTYVAGIRDGSVLMRQYQTGRETARHGVAAVIWTGAARPNSTLAAGLRVAPPFFCFLQGSLSPFANLSSHLPSDQIVS